MANFNTDVNLSPNYGISISHRPVQKVQRYADGYEHRLNFGIAAHQNPRTVNLQFEDITESESDTLINFLKARILVKLKNYTKKSLKRLLKILMLITIWLQLKYRMVI